jgi:type IV pilus assembly protein PilB
MVVATGFADENPDERILDILLAIGLITPDQRTVALNILYAECGDRDTGQIIVDLGFASDDMVGRARAKACNLQWFSFAKHKVEPEAIRLVPESIIRNHGILPVVRKGDKLYVAISDPTASINALDSIRTLLFIQNITLHPVLACRSELNAAIEHYLYNRDPM